MLVVGLSHKTAPIEVRERLALDGPGTLALLARLLKLDGIGEGVILSTCNRVEIYAYASNDERARAGIVELLCDLGGGDMARHLSSFTAAPALIHLFRVASSLDSLVIGEPQILGQLKEAIRVAEEARALGAELGAAMRAALGVAKKVRSETAIGAGQVSISSVAVDLARQIFDDLGRRTAVLVGAGEMAEAAANLLAKSGSRMLVCNRSAARAEALAAAVGGAACPWDTLDDCLVEADIVIASTSSPTPVITRSRVKGLRKQRRGRSLFLIDIAVPRDVEPEVNELENVYLYDIDDLSKVVASSLEGRAGEAERAERLVREEAQRFAARGAERSVAPVIHELRERTRLILGAELAKSLRGRLRNLGSEEREALEAMLDAAVNKLLHAPSTRLRALSREQQGEDLAEAVRQLFELGGGGPAVSQRSPDGAPRVSGTTNGRPAAQPASADAVEACDAETKARSLEAVGR